MGLEKLRPLSLEERQTRVIAVALILLTATCSLFVFQEQLSSKADVFARPSKAAIIDEVSVPGPASSPDPYFTDNVTKTLTKIGYHVDYYPPANVTIDLFRSLPSKGYGIIILRQHSTGLSGDVIALVTSEQYNQTKYVDERQAGLVVEARLGGDNTTYVGITPTFIREALQGTFSHTLLIATGCAGLANSEMAQAFLSRGAEVYVSWDQTVLANRSDGGTILFVKSITSGNNIDQAASLATENAPSDVYSSQLKYYPANMGGLIPASSS